MTLRDATEDETLGNSWELVGTQGTHPPNSPQFLPVPMRGLLRHRLPYTNQYALRTTHYVLNRQVALSSEVIHANNLFSKE
jgi:hypothetical protein